MATRILGWCTPCTLMLAVGLAISADPEGGTGVTTASKSVTIESGLTIQVEAGELEVPESRRRPTARRIALPFYRLRSEAPKPASPIFLLAGGPGSSWLDQLENEENFREVSFYRTLADVVLFDQRGGGHARPAMSCPQTAALKPDQPLDPVALRAAMRRALAQCRDHWQGQGVDLAAYNTVENAADVDQLRLALGYGKITLVGGSYGSHLALEIMRRYPDTIDRAVLFGVEGPDHTWDDPAAILATLGRIAAEAEQSAAWRGRIPPGGLLATLARVLARLEAEPRTVQVGEGAEAKRVVVDANTVRRMARAGAGRRQAPQAWPEMILAMDRGDFSQVARRKLENEIIGLADPVHYSMDCASGISPSRRARYRRDPAAAILGDLNFEYEALCDLWPSEDLGEGFRANLSSSIPTLIFHGTWDLSTPLDNAREVVSSLRNGQLVEVVRGSHGALYNLFERWPPMTELLGKFLAGGTVDFPESVVDPPAAASLPPTP